MVPQVLPAWLHWPSGPMFRRQFAGAPHSAGNTRKRGRPSRGAKWFHTLSEATACTAKRPIAGSPGLNRFPCFAVLFGSL